MASEQIIGILTEIESRIEAIIRSGSGWFEKLSLIIEVVVPKVEAIGLGWKGADKKVFALELLEEARKLYFKKVPAFLVRWIGGILIDKVVKFFNQQGVFKHSEAPLRHRIDSGDNPSAMF